MQLLKSSLLTLSLNIHSVRCRNTNVIMLRCYLAYNTDIVPLLYRHKVLNLRNLQASGASREGLRPLPEGVLLGMKEMESLAHCMNSNVVSSITSCAFISQSLNL